MEYIKKADYNYIMNKYHFQDRPFNSLARFIRNDEYFSEETGLDGGVIRENILKRDDEIKELSHPVRKAKAFSYILENTRISCDKRDIFPAINMIDRPLNAKIIGRFSDEINYDNKEEVSKRHQNLHRNGIATVWSDYDHSVPNWDNAFALGFKGILENSEKARQKFKNITAEQTAFFDGIKITYEAIFAFLQRLEERARVEENEKMAVALANIKNNPPKTFYETLLFVYIYFMLS